jgi:hypothetical protein
MVGNGVTGRHTAGSQDRAGNLSSNITLRNAGHVRSDERERSRGQRRLSGRIGYHHQWCIAPPDG